MNGDAKLKRFADASRFDAWSQPAPKGRVEQDHINGSVEHIGRELLEVDYDRVGRKRHAHLLAEATHARQAKHRVFQIVVADCFNLLAEPDRCFSRPDAVRIEAEAITV